MSDMFSIDAPDLELMGKLTIEMAENQITRTGMPTAIISTSALARQIIRTKHEIPANQMKSHPELFESMKRLAIEFIDHSILERHSRVYSNNKCYWFFRVGQIEDNVICGFLEVENKPSCLDS
ncbi:MAG: hypothetical protein EAX87_03420 [Candidatus Thorarchaeota archaeon]|nr:hypothetical protein [Candidatus Thorarchaeota archaeon]